MWHTQTQSESKSYLANAAFIGALVGLIVVLSGCGVSTTTAIPVGQPTKAYSMVDRLNRQVNFESSPKRVVSLSPATTELVFALGAGDLLMGATEYCNFPEQAKKIDRVGSGPVGTVSIESIVAKSPDLVLCKFDTHQPLIDSLERLNIKVIALGPESLVELCEEANWLGELLDRKQQANELIGALKARAKQLQDKVARLNAPQKTKVFYQVWADPLMSVANGSFIDELLGLAGLENIAHDVKGRYPQVSPELVVQRNPDVILVPSPPSKPIDVNSILDRTGWQDVSAIQNKRVYLIDSDIISRCGPRMLDAL
ncbi:MAG: helical backbone metal receptor, partial [Pirellulales bacterium]